MVLRVDSKIDSHSVCKMSSLFETLAIRLCEVIFERSLRSKSYYKTQEYL